STWLPGGSKGRAVGVANHLAWANLDPKGGEPTSDIWPRWHVQKRHRRQGQAGAETRGDQTPPGGQRRARERTGGQARWGLEDIRQESHLPGRQLRRRSRGA